MDDANGYAEKVDIKRGSSSRALLSAKRLARGVTTTILETVSNRAVTTYRWNGREERWIHHWPEGRASDKRLWKTANAWATLGGKYDMGDLLWRHYRPQPGDTVVDIGAGHGGETFFLAGMVGSAGRVLAIEPAPDPYQRLTELVALNRWPQVETVRAALASEPGSVSMSSGANWIAGHVDEGGDLEVPAVTLDALCAQRRIDSIDWLKMNIEGAEKEAVLGMERMAPMIKNMTISCHDFLGTDFGRSKTQVELWLRAHGFEIEEHEPAEPWASDYIYARQSRA